MHGEDQDFGPWQSGADLAGGLRTVDDRHRVIQQHDIRQCFKRLADGFFTVTGLAYDCPAGLRLQDAAEARTHHFMVVCDENSCHRFSLARIVEQVLPRGHPWKPGFDGTVNADMLLLAVTEPARTRINRELPACAARKADLHIGIAAGLPPPEPRHDKPLVNGHDDVNSGATRAGANPQVAAELVHPRLNAADADAGPKICTVAPHRPRHTMAVVGDHQMNATRNPSQLDGNV